MKLELLLCTAIPVVIGALFLREMFLERRRVQRLRRMREALMVTDNYARCPKCGSTKDVRFSRYALVKGDWQEHWHCDACGCDYRYVNENPRTAEPPRGKQSGKAGA